MTKVPRASLCISILGDEDYRILMRLKGGIEAFGIFVALVLTGRERLHQGHAGQVSGSESLMFYNSTSHVADLACVTEAQLTRAVAAFDEVAKKTGGGRWMYLDDSSHLVIRSFFKFNASPSWGGARPGAGRPKSKAKNDSSENQDESSGNQEKASWGLSDSDSDSDSLIGEGPAHRADAGARACTHESPAPPVMPAGGGDGGATVMPTDPGGEGEAAAVLAGRLFGDGKAAAVRSSFGAIEEKTGGRWDCFAAALEQVHREQQRAAAKPVDDLIGLSIVIAKKYIARGLPTPVGSRNGSLDKHAAAEQLKAKILAREAERGR